MEIKRIDWTKDLDTGIPDIDRQHRQIVNYINSLVDNRQSGERQVIEEVLSELIEYTVSHFGFEESLMEQAQYSYLTPHIRIHRLFEKRVREYAERFVRGEEVTDELIEMLNRWLITHIRAEDMDYTPLVSKSLGNDADKERLLEKTFGRFFGKGRKR